MADVLEVLVCREYEKNGEKKTFWMRVGSAFKSKDGKGINVELTALPVNGKLIIRPPLPKDAQGKPAGKPQQQNDEDLPF